LKKTKKFKICSKTKNKNADKAKTQECFHQKPLDLFQNPLMVIFNKQQNPCYQALLSSWEK